MHLGFGFMIINIVFFLGLLSGVINSRSVTETRKIHNAPYGLIPIGQKPLATIVGFLGGPIAISAIVIWGFISLKWYFVIISWIICGAICRLFVEKKFNCTSYDIVSDLHIDQWSHKYNIKHPCGKVVESPYFSKFLVFKNLVPTEQVIDRL